LTSLRRQFEMEEWDEETEDFDYDEEETTEEI
jgi:hypothetical protein